jgi:hypothetical protein
VLEGEGDDLWNVGLKHEWIGQNDKPAGPSPYHAREGLIEVLRTLHLGVVELQAQGKSGRFVTAGRGEADVAGGGRSTSA